MPDNGLQVRELLPTRFENMDDVVKRQLLANAQVNQAGLPNLVWKVVGGKATEAVRSALDCDVFSLVARAWAKALELHKFKDETKYPPSKKATLFLGEHKLKTEIHPVLDVIFGPALQAQLRFTVELAAEFQTGELSIWRGHIVGVGTGEGQITAQLKYGESALHDKFESRKFKLSPFELPAPGLLIL
jgi:hypothetical protein